MGTGENFLWPDDLDYHLAGDPGITRDMILRAYRDARAGRIDSAAAILSQALWPGCWLMAPADTGEMLAPPAHQEGPFDGDDDTRDVEYLVEAAYEDLISKRIPEAMAKLEEALYPDGIPPHVQVVEWFRYLRHSEPMPEGWRLADDLSGTPHGHHARLIKKVT